MQNAATTSHFSAIYITALLAIVLAIVLPASQPASASTAASEPVIVVFGDSLSAGYGIDAGRGWVNLLSEKLRNEGYAYQVVNASISGETTDGGLQRLDKTLQRWQPSLLIVELGGNDGLRGKPLSGIKQNLQDIVEKSLSSNSGVLMLGMQIPPNYGPRYTRQFFSLFDEVASEYQLPLVPFFLDGVATRPELMQSDGIHPTAEAQPLMLELVWSTLQPLLQSPTPVAGEVQHASMQSP